MLAKAELLIKAMRIFCCQKHARSFECGIFKDALDEPFAQSLAAMLWIDDDVAQVTERRIIGDNGAETNLLALGKQPETERECPRLRSVAAFGRFAAQYVPRSNV